MNWRVVFTILISAFVTVSCSNSKFEQCQKIIDVTISIADESNQYLETKNLPEILKVADAFEEAAKEMNSISIEDEKLQQYKQDFAEIYQRNGKATQNFVEAFKNKNLDEAISLKTELINISKNEEALVNKMNQYCQSN